MQSNKIRQIGTQSGTLVKRDSSKQKLKRGARHGITELIYSALCKLRAAFVSELAQYIWDSDEDRILQNFKSLHSFNRFVDKSLKGSMLKER